MSDDPTISVQSLGDLTRILEQGRLAASALPFAIRQRVLKALVQALKADRMTSSKPIPWIWKPV
jgi:hypothetical protein